MKLLASKASVTAALNVTFKSAHVFDVVTAINSSRLESRLKKLEIYSVVDKNSISVLEAIKYITLLK